MYEVYDMRFDFCMVTKKSFHMFQTAFMFQGNVKRTFMLLFVYCDIICFIENKQMGKN